MTLFTFRDRVGETTATVGQGIVTLSGAVNDSFFTFVESGILDAQLVGYLIKEGLDFEIGYGSFVLTTPAMTRDIVLSSKISGVAGTTKMTLAGSAEVYNVAVAQQYEYDHLEHYFLAAQF